MPRALFRGETIMSSKGRAPAARRVALLAVATTCLLTGAANSSTPSADECTEAAEFIGNAARARDNGMARSAFLDQMQSDFDSIRAFPNELRWFVHDTADEAFLLSAAGEVFDHPESPELHKVAFFHACMGRLMV
jgi:hypothetical protein